MWKLGLLAIALSGLTAAACGGDESLETVPLPTAPDDPSARTFTREGYSFSYPGNWVLMSEVLPSGGSPGTVSLSGGTETEELTVTVSQVPRMIELGRWDENEDSYFTQEDYLETVADVPRRVTADNLDRFTDWRVPKYKLKYEDVREGPFATTVDGLPALYLVGEGTDVARNEILVQSVLVFDGETEYAIDCEYSPAREDDMPQVCARAFDTFRLD